MACSKLSASCPQEESLTSSSPDLRLCAFCFKSLDLKGLKKCGRCHRRAYCSRACQATDWTKAGGPFFVEDSEGERNGVGQGHKHWCGVPYGEEGEDWVVKAKEPKGSDKKTGVFALRDLPRFFRIMVEGLKKVTDGGGCRPGHKTPHQHFLFGEGVEYEGFRVLEVDHACAANAGLIKDESVKALIMYASRPILAGEEITMQLKFHNNVFLPIPSPREYADILLKGNGVVCPSDCACKDQNVRAKLEELRAEVARLKEDKNRSLSVEKAKRLLQMGNEVIPLGHLSGLHGLVCRRVLLGAGTQDWEVLKPLDQYMLEGKEFVEAVLHPKRFGGAGLRFR